MDAARSEQPGSWASRATLALIHFVLAITKILEDTFYNVVALVERAPSQDAFVHLRKKLAKAPNYVCIALTDDFSPAHVARVACWCSKLGIPQVAVWDRDGSMARQRDALAGELSKAAAKLSSTIRMVESMPRARAEAGTVVCIHAGDGRAEITDLVRRVESFPRSTEDMADLLGGTLSDPDLMLLFGPLPSYGGCLTWHLRLTEILMLGRLPHFTFRSFSSAMLAYSACNQRFGK